MGFGIRNAYSRCVDPNFTIRRNPDEVDIVNFEYTPEEQAFRAEVRKYLQANLPRDLSEKILNYKQLHREDWVRWHKILAAKGWSVTGWPVVTIRRGEVVYAGGQVAGTPGSGELLRPGPTLPV